LANVVYAGVVRQQCISSLTAQPSAAGNTATCGLSRHALNHHSPAQAKPLPVKPVLQVHERAPPLKVQVASALQPPLLMGHGSTAENTQHVGVETGGEPVHAGAVCLRNAAVLCPHRPAS